MWIYRCGLVACSHLMMPPAESERSVCVQVSGRQDAGLGGRASLVRALPHETHPDPEEEGPQVRGPV